MARGIAPGLERWFAFEQLKNFNRSVWHTMKERSRAQQSPSISAPLYGYDRDETMIEAARVNLQHTRLSDMITLQRKNILDLTPPTSKGIVLTNPPYGLRLDEEESLAELYPRLGNLLKQRFVGWKAYFFTADRRLPKLIRLSPSRRTPLFNGDLECRLYEFALIQGGNRRTSRIKPGLSDVERLVGKTNSTK